MEEGWLLTGGFKGWWGGFNDVDRNSRTRIKPGGQRDLTWLYAHPHIVH